MSVQVDRLTVLECDIDTRLAALWQEAFAVEDWTLETVGAFLRAAFGAGYVEAMSEPVPGQFVRMHGYRVPKRRQP